MSEEQLEKALRDALRREDAPPDFAAKVLTKRPKQRRSVAFALAAALAAMAIIPAVMVEHHRREEARGLKAKQDLINALAMTREQFREAKLKLRQTTGDTQ